MIVDASIRFNELEHGLHAVFSDTTALIPRPIRVLISQHVLDSASDTAEYDILNRPIS